MKLYLRYRKAYIKAERAKTPNQPNRCTKMNIDIVKMTEIIEETHKIINAKQRTSSSIENNFRSAGQDPWVNSEVESKFHLDNLLDDDIFVKYRFLILNIKLVNSKL